MVFSITRGSYNGIPSIKEKPNGEKIWDKGDFQLLFKYLLFPHIPKTIFVS
jgi:hypothetical protein